MDLSPDEDNFQGRLLHQAALWDNVELLEELIASGADVDARDARQRTALHAAALADRSRCLQALCAAGADVDARADRAVGGETALHIAAERGHVDNIRTLLRAGADLGACDAQGDTPLALAERNHRRHAANALRAHRDAVERERLSQHAALRELISRGEAQQLKTRLAALGSSAGIIVNLTPGGANTLLYIASEAGLTTAVAALLDAGADGRAHPVTRYGPLYAACYHGHLEIAKMLLVHFPSAVQQETVEKWLPLHAACIGGHAAIVTLLLSFPYPEEILNTYTDESGQWQYRFPFDVNAVDARGQTALYAACARGSLAVVEALLAHELPATAVPTTPGHKQPQVRPESPSRDAVSKVLSPQRGGISMGIHAIVSKLTGATSKDNSDNVHRVRPVRLESRSGDSCVSRAVRADNARLLQRLLRAGAKPDAPAHPPQTDWEGTRDGRRRSRSASAAASLQRGCSVDRDLPWTALAIAARAKNVQMVEMLLDAGATDPHGLAVRECARHNLLELLAKLLATKAYPDPDYKLNKSLVSESVFSSRDADTALTYTSMCPTTAVMINWRELRCQLATVRMSWLRQAALRVNRRLSANGTALLSLTRLDLANNELRTLPPDLFTLLSLRYLNVAQNKLERLPRVGDPLEEEPKKTRKKHKRPEIYSAPVLQDLYLQDNRLEEIPPELFRLPALVTLDVSNNKLRSLPDSVWSAPALKDLNVALNHLRDLPVGDEAPSNGESSPLQSPAGPSPPPGAASPTAADSKHSSRSPSIERSESEALEDDDDAPVVIANRAGNAVWSSAHRPHAWRGEVDAADATETASGAAGGSRLTALNLSHNQFACVPAALACRAPGLTRLNMAYNSLRSMSYVTSYPTSLRQLDLSHNEITCWPSLPQIESFGSSEGDPLACYCPNSSAVRSRPRSGGSVRAQLLSAACAARRHLRLEGLRTLILSNNLLTRIQLTTDDDGLAAADSRPHQPTDDDWESGGGLRPRLLFPLLSMLDVSCNLLKTVPPAIHLLSNLSVLNLSGNKDITELPPQMGLLSRLWNLNASGCSLNEPLRSMLRGGRYKSADVVGYLKSVLHEARPYTTMKLMLVGHQGIGKTSLLECLRQESAIQHRRKPTDHWAKRMGNKSSRRGNISTVGVDIGTWVYEKHRSTRGPVTFRTWDFGGQQEYYATHQYFLSRRSLYLVVWRATDGRKGLASALDWLRSIQARAPGSPVIMVATHYDQVANCNLPESETPEALQRLIRCSIMGAPDADKRGLPRVLDSVEVSCSTRHNIRLLADIIYSVAWSVRPPGSKEPLLQQPVPASYLALEECVSAATEPVMRHHDYKRMVTQYMQSKNLRMFRDAAELHQATMFLHENGVVLHYDDATLKELYFLRPQWLCDVLAHVVTVREVNPFASQGIMRTEDLAHVFKASPLLGGGEEAGSLGAMLLNKFELALGWDARVLLVPPLLPDKEPHTPQLALRGRGSGRGGTPRRAWPHPAPQLTPAPEVPHSETSATECGGVVLSARAGCAPLRRLLLVSYVPRGFWPRLCTRVLADAALATAATRLYRLPPELEVDESVTKALDLNWGWKLWKTGMVLCSGDLTLVSVRELPPKRDDLLPPPPTADPDDEEEDLYHTIKFRMRCEGSWCTLDASMWACIELLLPASTAVIRRPAASVAGCQSISLEPNPETLAKALALVSDHVDLLLEDWYPSLGTRFVHTSEGRCLITRLVPCPPCLRAAAARDIAHEHRQLAQEFRRIQLGQVEPRRPRLSQDSRDDDADSGVGPESNASSRVGSVEGIVNGAPVPEGFTVNAWAVEECILAACTNQQLACPHHGPRDLGDIAPDTLLLDVEEEKRARWEHIVRGGIAGRGAFGTVLVATWRPPHAPPTPVALKTLQPVPPPPDTPLAKHHAYKAALSRWEREPVSAACRAYLGLRQELGVLQLLRHPHVVPLTAVCGQPLALLLALAPQGALDQALRQYAGCGCRVGPRAARALSLQLAKALEYLHSSRVLYRDLKSENVLVWALPQPQEAHAAELSHAPIDVHVKLGDYGISRLAPPSGTKGFGGTEGFMAPEIMRYNGEEEYNEKVDCFSFGMLLYEVMSLRQPFEGHEAVKEAVLEGARPTLTTRELEYPCTMLEAMRRCWSNSPELRPSAAALVSALAAPEYPALGDAAAARPAAAAAACPRAAPTGGPGEDWSGGWEVWYGGEPERAHSLLATRHHFTHHHSLRLPPDKTGAVQVTAICRVGSKMWLGDSAGRVTVYNASSMSPAWCVVVSEAVGGAASPVSALLPLPRLKRVALALQCGRLFLVSSSRPAAEGGFVLSELGAATELCCLAAVPKPHGWEVWAGGDGLSAYSITDTGVCGAETVPLTPRVTHLAPHPRLPLVVAATHPGTHVYQLSAVTRQQTARLDCSKLAPCSESLHSLGDLAADPAHDRCQVTALCVLGECVYAGCAGGGVVVADATSLRPLTVFRPYEHSVTCIVPLVSHAGAPGPPLLATFGDTYRPLLNRFQPQNTQQNNGNPDTLSGFHCLLWRAHHWLPD